MMWLVENWILIVAAVAILAVVGSFVLEFYSLPTKKQVETIKEWLLYACIQAEAELGDGTGQLKLRYVYDLFISRFPSAAKVVPFALFSLWVDSALEEMRQMLTQNKAIREVVKGGNGMKLTNVGLAEFVKTKLGTPYVYGAKGKVLTQANFNYLQNRYGSKMVWNSDERKVGKVCVDCSGLISWYTGKLKGSTQFKNESIAHPISTIASAPIGAAVWRQGHIGVYIGNGEVIEARGSQYGVVRTKVKDRDFTHWFLLKDIEYIEGDEEMVTRERIIIDGKEKEVDMIRKDGTTYIKTRDFAKLLNLKVGNKGSVPTLDKK